jgi:hypothetical protein
MDILIEKLNVLISEIQSNTAAINKLAAFLISESDVEDESEEEVVKTYLDGTPFVG